MRVIGLDVHRNFAQVAILENGLVKNHGRFAMDRDAVLNFGAQRFDHRLAPSSSKPPAYQGRLLCYCDRT